MATKKSAAPVTTKSGVDKIIDHLIKHRDQIGAIVLIVTAKPDGKVTHTDGDADCDGYTLMADNILGDAECRAKEGAHTAITRGLVADTYHKVFKPRGMFG